MRFLQLAGKSYAKYFKIDIFIKQFNGNLIRKLLHIDSVLNGINFNDFSFADNLYRFLTDYTFTKYNSTNTLEGLW